PIAANTTKKKMYFSTLRPFYKAPKTRFCPNFTRFVIIARPYPTQASTSGLYLGNFGPIIHPPKLLHTGFNALAVQLKGISIAPNTMPDPTKLAQRIARKHAIVLHRTTLAHLPPQELIPLAARTYRSVLILCGFADIMP